MSTLLRSGKFYGACNTKRNAPLIKVMGHSNYNCPDYEFDLSDVDASRHAVTGSASGQTTSRGTDRSEILSGVRRDSASTCGFLRLPLELRQQIYGYVLPYTFGDRSRFPEETCWRRGNTTILATNHQIHSEASAVLYGSNRFHVVVEYDRVVFKCQWLLPTDLAPNRAYPFPDHFRHEYLARIRDYFIRVYHVDDHIGMIKYNFQGAGLSKKYANQVEALCRTLGQAEELKKLEIVLVGPVLHPSMAQKCLEPLRTLRGVGLANIHGPVGQDFKMTLEADMEKEDGHERPWPPEQQKKEWKVWDKAMGMEVSV